MNILLLAPQPFFQVRGTPIAIDLLVSTLSKQGHNVDLLTYHEGEPRDYAQVKHIRIRAFRFLNGVKPGFSLKKLCCSGLLFFAALNLLRKNRHSENRYHVVHANEESVFMAYIYRKLFKVPYIYDMDSSLVTQIVDKMPALAKLRGFFSKFENGAIKNSIGVLPVCEALCEIARPLNSNVTLLTDVAMLDQLKASDMVVNLDKEYKLSGLKLMYIGNLESYQGVDLLIEGFAIALQTTGSLNLVIIGGTIDTITHYESKCAQLGISESVVFAGAKPFTDIEAYMNQADILVSPRTKGENTPMKIYNYMASGKAMIATDIYSHTQVLDDSIAKLVSVDSNQLAKAIIELANSEELRTRLATRCSQRARESYSIESFEAVVAEFFQNIETMLNTANANAD